MRQTVRTLIALFVFINCVFELIYTLKCSALFLQQSSFFQIVGLVSCFAVIDLF